MGRLIGSGLLIMALALAGCSGNQKEQTAPDAIVDRQCADL